MDLYEDVGDLRIARVMTSNTVEIYSDSYTANGPVKIRHQQTPSEWHTIYLYIWATNNPEKALEEFKNVS